MICTKRLLDRFLQLVALDSPSFDERAVRDFIVKELKELGLDAYEDDTAGKIGGTSGNLYAVLEGDIDAPPILLCAHMDTVEPARNKSAVVGMDGKITSGGDTVLGADDFSGIAVILEALTSVREDHLPHRTIELFFSVAEEAYDWGSEQFDRSRFKAREAYVLDMAGEIGAAAYAAPTILSFEAEVIGKTSHAGFEPEKGIHAIAIAAKAVAALNIGQVTPEVTMNIGTISGGLATNIVPEQCLVSGEIRSFQHALAMETLEHVQRVFRAEAQSMGGRLNFTSRVGCKAYETDLDTPVVQRYLRACRGCGAEPELVRTFGGSDLNQLAEKGIAGLVIASGMFQVHTCQEYTTTAALSQAAEITQLLITSAE